MERNKSIIQHSNELKNRLLVTAGFLLALFVPGYFYAAKIYYYFSLPVVSNLPKNSELVSTSVTAGYFTPIELVLWLSVLGTIPLALYQLYAYLRPALNKKEAKKLTTLLVLGVILFFGGLTASYLFIMPVLIKFFIQVLPNHIVMMLDMEHYTYFVLKTSLLVAMVCQLPIIMTVLAMIKVVKGSTFSKYRKYYYILAFVASMFITPPDLIFQVMVGIPIILLFETGILLIKCFKIKEVL